MSATKGRAPARMTLALLLLLWPVAAWSKLPEWAERVAAEAPEIADDHSEHHARVLLSEMRYQIQPGGKLSVRRRLALQALRPDAQWKVGSEGFFFQPTAKVSSARAWHLAPGGRAIRNWYPPVDVTVGDAFLTDRKARVVSVEGVRRGSLIFFEFEALDTPYFMSLSHQFLEDGPVTLARLEVEVPPGWTMRAEWLHGDGPEATVAGGVSTWERRDIPYPDVVAMEPSRSDTAPVLVVQVVPGEGVPSQVPTFANWEGAGVWYAKLIEGRDGITPEIRTAATVVFADAGPGLLDRVKAAGTYVRDSVRYIAIELGIGGWQPHEASQTLGRLYGDCKDKGTLFRALLATEGVPSFPVLVNLTTTGTVSRQLAVLAFNHFVVAIPLPSDLDVSPAFQAAVADGGELGRLLIVDTTDDRVAIGSISGGLSGKLGLVVADGRGRLVELPHGADAHRVERRIRFEIHPDGSQAVARASRYLGEFAATARADYGVSVTEREKRARARVDEIWTGADMSAYAAEPETADGSFMETATLSVDAPPGRDDGVELRIFPGATLDVPRVPLARRTQAVDYRHGQVVTYDVTLRPIPERVPLPTPFREEGDGWLVVTSYERAAGTVKAHWEMHLSRSKFETTEFSELRRFWTAVSSTTSQFLLMPRAPGR